VGTVGESFQSSKEITVNRKKTSRPLVLAAVMLAMFMAAIEGTIVATAMPDIVGELGGFSLYSWVFSAYLLMQAVLILIYGKLSDLFGRKPVFIFGITMFMIGSVLCGFAPSMLMLIVFRFIQGIGAGAVQPIATTIVGDMYTLEERAKIQGYLSSVWGISAVVGPLVGGLIVQYSDWAWVFWMNVPLGILAIVGVVLFLHEGLEKQKHPIDYAGSGLLFVSISSLMVVLIQGGVAWSWASAPVILLLAIFVLSLLLFVQQEKRAKAPMVPPEIWKHRLIALANAASLTSGVILIGVSSFLPAFVQGVMGYSAIVAGFTLTTMSIGWPISSIVAGRLVIKIGFRPTAIMGGTALLIGSLFFMTLDPAKGPIWAGVGSFIVGTGMGLTTTTFIVSIQNSVGWQMRGIATASNMFMRILGSAVGAALLGGILNMSMKQFLQEKSGVSGELITVDTANILLDEAGQERFSEETLHVLQEGLTQALHYVYFGVFVFALLTLVFALFFPKTDRNEK
jgi:EmrB/QacA subfamily drug resistance transporter